MPSEWLIDKKVELRPHEDGSFDELVLTDDGECIVHAEMMDRGGLWIGIYPRGQEYRRVVMWIRAKGNKLLVRAEED